MPVQLPRRLATLLVAVLAFALLAATAAPAHAARSTDLEAHLTRLVNEARSAQGLAPLAVRADIVTVAVAWSEQLAVTGVLAHNPLYSTQVCCWTRVAENVGRSSVSAADDPARLAERLHAAFMGSDGHRRNILNPDFTEVGIGAVITETQAWVTQNFRTPKAAPVEEPSPEPTPEPTPEQSPAPAAEPAPTTSQPSSPAPTATTAPKTTTSTSPTTTGTPSGGTTGDDGDDAAADEVHEPAPVDAVAATTHNLGTIEAPTGETPASNAGRDAAGEPEATATDASTDSSDDAADGDASQDGGLAVAGATDASSFPALPAAAWVLAILVTVGAWAGFVGRRRDG